jgi:catechol 2,3-dioxygenase-like lactoylglutathione lyase family enzyme
MKVNALDHVNIVVEDLDSAARFYSELLGLERRNGPPPLTAEQAQWMHDAEGRPIIHLNARNCPRLFDRDMGVGSTGALHHVALNCSGFAEVRDRIHAAGLPYEVNVVDSIDLRQIFVSDPHGVVLELNFFGD